jgi:hypothetical protein
MVDLVETVICRDCGEEKPRWKPQQNLCHDCYKIYLRNYASANRDKLNADKRSDYHRKVKEDPVWKESERLRQLEFYHRLRREVFEAYGGMKCACCGETEETFLTLDHINNDGAEHRRSLSKTGRKVTSGVWHWIKRNNFPPGFQVLCMNCNFSKFRNNGVCAHKLSQP